jgi:hypothetical protein
VKFRDEDGSETQLVHFDGDLVFAVGAATSVELSFVVDGVLVQLIDLQNNAL